MRSKTMLSSFASLLQKVSAISLKETELNQTEILSLKQEPI